MDTLLCYFYSTIAQVLAGAIGLLGIFCLYKLSLIKDEIRGLAESMVLEIETGNYTEEERSYNKNNIRRLSIGAMQGNPIKMKNTLDQIYNYFLSRYPKTNMNDQIIIPFETLINKRDGLIKHTKIALAYNVIIIFISVLVIPFIKSVLEICSECSIDENYNCLSIIFITTLLLLFLVDLIYITWVVFKALR